MTAIFALNRVLIRRFLVLGTLLLILSYSHLSGQYYGMQFASHENPLDQRSGLDLSPDGPYSIKENLDLQFYLRFDPGHESYYGYIFRMVLGDQRIDFTHVIIPENPNNFELIIDKETSKIAFQIPLEVLMEDWTKFRFSFDFKNEKVSCYINDSMLVDDLKGFDEKNGFRLMFGEHSYGIFNSKDVPPMILRDVEMLSNGKDQYRWPLNETEGSIAHSEPGGNDGVATNPVWLLKRHNTWENLLNRVVPGGVRFAFDPENENLFFLSQDSVFIFDLVNKDIRSISHTEPSSVETTNSLIFNPAEAGLTKYSLDNNFVSTFNPETGSWTAYDPGPEVETEFWHHNQEISPDGSLITFGGYGHYEYRNAVLKWNDELKRFDSIKFNGDFFPRYLAGAGYNPSDSLYYIIGGFGSESGRQNLGPGYYYELLSFSPADNTFSRVHEFSNTQAGFCFANSLVFDDDNNLYALYFPNDDGNNKLQLIKVSLDSPEIIELGDPIEYSFLDIKSHADLFYCRANNSLLAVSSYTDENQTNISVHTIAFPPQKFSLPEVESKKSKLLLILFIAAGSMLLLSAPVVYRNRKRKKASPEKVAEFSRENSTPKRKENSIILFGGFQVFDRKGNDITGQFTPLPKKLFLFILLHSLRNNKGVSSAVLYETFWFDKSVESARNNRAVNIVKLKSLLDNLDSASISKDTGYWKFDFDPSLIRIDYYEYLQIIGQASEPTRKDIVALLSTIENKTFLNNTQADWLDPFKSEISNEVIDLFIRYISTSKDDPEFLLHLTNCIFLFDAVSEEALKVQCRLLIKQGKHSLAKSSYSKFIREYRQLYDEDYNLSFSQVIDDRHHPDSP